MTHEILKLCPFCGGESAIKINSGAYYQWSTWIECRKCRARGGQMFFGNNGTLNPDECNYNGREEAIEVVIKLWNNRV